MTEENPKNTILKLIKAKITLKKNDQSTATVRVCPDMTEEKVQKQFQSFDAVVTIGKVKETPKRIGFGKILFLGEIKVGGWSKDKAGVTGRKMQWQIEQEIDRIFRQFMRNPGGNLSLAKLTDTDVADRIDIKSPLFHTVFTISTWRYKTIEEPE